MCTKAAGKCSELLPLPFGSEGVQGRMCGPRKYSYSPHGGLLEIQKKGLLRPKFLKESVKQNWTLQIRGWWGGSGSGGGGGNKSPKNSHEGVWIFAGTTTPFPKTN